jgi:hypothetical protein
MTELGERTEIIVDEYDGHVRIMIGTTALFMYPDTAMRLAQKIVDVADDLDGIVHQEHGYLM